MVMLLLLRLRKKGREMKRGLTLLLLSWCIGQALLAQPTISRYVISSVGMVTHDTADYTLSATLGDVSVGFLSDQESKRLLTVGFQQPAIRAIIIPEPDEFVTVAPNPVRSELYVKFLFHNFSYNIDVYDINGTKRAAYPAFNMDSNSEFPIDFSDFPAGLFLVHVYSDSGELSRVFKIEKIW